jgi:hypothetical protein
MDPALDEAGVVSWDSNIDWTFALTNDFTAVKNQIDLVDSSGGTNLNAGLQGACNVLDAGADPGSAHVIIFLTDGVGSYTWSGTPGSWADYAASQGYVIYAIGLGSASAGPLQDMADATGGDYFVATTADDLIPIFEDIAGEVIDMAAKDVIVTDILMPQFSYVPGSATIVPTSIVGNTLTWDVGTIGIDEVWTVSFDITCSVPGYWLVNEFPTSGVSYTKMDDTAAFEPFPEVWITVYAPPVADAGQDQTVPEGTMVTFDGTGSYDPDGWIVDWSWDVGGIVMLSGPTPSFYFSDDAEIDVILTVTDNDGFICQDTMHLSVVNVDPTIDEVTALIYCDLTIRVAGSKWSNVEVTVYEVGDPDDVEVAFMEVERWPGDPDLNPTNGGPLPGVWDMTKEYYAVVTYDPFPDAGDLILGDQPNNGNDPFDNAGNPVWLIFTCEDGEEHVRVHHTFNTQQSMIRDSTHWNHVEPWIVPINPLLVCCDVEVTVTATDPGSDDIGFWKSFNPFVITWHNNDGSVLNWPTDPYPSWGYGTSPFTATDVQYSHYSGPETILIWVEDDDGGAVSTTIDLA